MAVEEALFEEAKRLNDTGVPGPLLAWQVHLRVVTEGACDWDDPTAAGLANSLGSHLEMIGDYWGARPYCERALAIDERVLGPEHPATASGLDSLGFILQKQGNFAEARPYYERGLAIREKVLGKDIRPSPLGNSDQTPNGDAPFRNRQGAKAVPTELRMSWMALRSRHLKCQSVEANQSYDEPREPSVMDISTIGLDLGEKRFSGARCWCVRRRCGAQDTATFAGPAVLRQAVTMPRRDGGVLYVASLGAQDALANGSFHLKA